MVTTDSIHLWDEFNEVDQLIDSCLQELFRDKIHFLHAKASLLKSSKPFVNAEHNTRFKYVLVLICKIHEYTYGGDTAEEAHANHIRQHLRELCLKYTLSRRVALDSSQVHEIVSAFVTYRTRYDSTILHWPLAEFLKQLEWKYRKAAIPAADAHPLLELKAQIIKLNSILRIAEKFVARIDKLVGPPVVATELKHLFFDTDKFGKFANALVKMFPKSAQHGWEALLELAVKNKSSAPTSRFMHTAKQLIEAIGVTEFFATVEELMLFVMDLKPTEVEKKIWQPGNESKTILVSGLMVDENAHILAKLIWTTSIGPSANMDLIARFCIRCFTNIPMRGAALGAVGNACLHVLSSDRIDHRLKLLASLKYKIRQPSVRARIQLHLESVASQSGLEYEELEDQLVEDCSLDAGTYSVDVGRYSVTIAIKNNAVAERWSLNGRQFKSVPAEVKASYASDFKKVRDHVRRIQLTVGVQRQRLDQMFRRERKFTWRYFAKFYLSHGLLGVLARDLIWNVETNGVISTYGFINGCWATLKGEVLAEQDDNVVTLWHPLLATDEEVGCWQNIFLHGERQQPIRQLYREVHRITDAERITRTYSNRMAGHILRQHQFGSLTKVRGWNYSLQVSADSGSLGEIASLRLPFYDLKAEFFIPQVQSGFPVAVASGVLSYVSTDAIRFLDLRTEAARNLVDIPPIIFSEVMRDCELFVGVAGIASDETWHDRGGHPVFVNYWEMASVAELSEREKMRKVVLQNLIVSPPYASACTIEDRYLMVRGKLHQYKIHIGSGHVRTEPGFRFICIVPSGIPPKTLFLPFDGDHTLAIILSKIHLLMHDDQITDPKILSQL